MGSKVTRLPTKDGLVRLGELIEVKHGFPFKGEHMTDDLSGLPIVVSIGNFEYTGGFRFQSTTLREYRGEYPLEYRLQAGDILLVMTCQTPGGEILGLPGKIPRDGRTYLHNQRLGKVVITRPDKIDRDFLYWLFLTTDFNRELVSSATGTKILHTSPGRIEAARVSIPNLAEQQRVAGILNTLESKITLLRETNATLEAIAQAIFKSWFVDFDPVRAKAEGRDPEGVPPEVADLFPSEFKDSELGAIPKGWRAGSVDEEFNLVMGQSPPGCSYNEEGDGVPFFQGRTDFGFRFPTNRMYCSAPTRFALPGDTLVSVRAPVGDINMALERCCIGRGVASIRHKSGALSFTFYAMREEENQFAHFESDGTIFGSIGKKDFHALRLVLPPPDVIEAFESFAAPLDERVKTNESEMGSLIGLRDTLLPRLMSGKLRISDLLTESA